MAKSESQLAKSVLLKFGKIAAEESPSPEDQTYIIDEYRSKLADWSDDEMVYWDRNEIPDAVYATIVKLMVNEVQNAFGGAASLEDMAQREILLLKRLRRHKARGRSGLSTRAQYY